MRFFQEKFNFNKSCIWIDNINDIAQKINNLTLTRVVFEYLIRLVRELLPEHLTLTRVVFELLLIISVAIVSLYLTLTRVVFEFIIF